MNTNQHDHESKALVRAWVDRDPMGYGYLLDFYQRGARVCYAGEDGLVLKNDKIDICYAGGTVWDVPELRTSWLLMVEGADVKDALVKIGRDKSIMECRQAVYQKQTPAHAERPGAAVRPLTMDDLDFVLENYHNPGAFESHIRDRIQEGMLGGELDGQLAGFAGIHQEGSMGMLEVLPQFRRRGLAEVLEAAVINQQLERGRLPYCHVRTGNTASERLQEKMGLTFDNSRLLYWIE